MKIGTAGRILIALVVVAFALASPVLTQRTPDVPKVRIVATGGTIAGEQQQPGTLGGYEIKKNVNEIVALIPHVQRYAQVETEQFSNVASPSITPDHWLRLAQRINTILKDRPDLAGIVVTHGTARLEETAFFLYLTIKSDRPVVDRIISARDVTKVYARGGGFESAEMGMLGTVTGSGVEFFYQPVRKHTATSDFDVSALQRLPRVGISYSYSGAQGVADQEAQGVVVATTGLAPDEDKYYQELRKNGVIVATTFPSGQQVADSPDRAESALPPVIAVKHLMPTKARILMMLALTKTQNVSEIQKIFDTY